MRSLPTRLLGLTVTGTLLAGLSAIVNPAHALTVPPNVAGNQTVVRYPLADAKRLTVNITVPDVDGHIVDTDGDGNADKVQLRIKRPDTTKDGNVRVPTIIDPSIYNGTTRSGDNFNLAQVQMNGTEPSQFKTPNLRWDYSAPLAAPPEDWDLIAKDAFMDNYFVPRGYAVAELDALGTGNSEGCLGVGSKYEQAGVKAAIDWLNGRAKGYKPGTNTEITAADWSNGKAALQGRSYDGALSIEGAASGVDGLKTIVTHAGISDWYRYQRSNGAVVNAGAQYVGYDVNTLASEYNDGLSSAICEDRLASDITDKFAYDSGDRNAFWDERNYTNDAADKPKASVFVVQGMRDDAVRPENASVYWKALQDWGVPSKLWITQDEHKSPYRIRPLEYLTQLHRWYDYWLYDLPNGIMAESKVDVQQSDLTWTTQNSWPAAADTVSLSTRLDAAKTTRSLVTSPNWNNSVYDEMTQSTGKGLSTTEYKKLTNSDSADLTKATLQYLSTPLRESVTLEGAPTFKAVAKIGGASPYLIALLVDFDEIKADGTRAPAAGQHYADPATPVTRCIEDVEPGPQDPNIRDGANTGCVNMRTAVPDTGTYRVISRGWLDTRNYDRTGTPVFNERAESVVPGNTFQLYKWQGQPMQVTVAKDHQIGLILLPVDTRNTLHYVGTNGDQATTLTLGTETSGVTLPVKSGRAAFGG
ncbi:CocE/NonD family hydrolase [Kitasatospora indigofera]|uniref:CocE/NonD family hydrolase n=1 Tax=Kitasatospora TaxID=2063 RepID=UPI0017494AB4|nr:CocE/NonD family hydrolase [Kitasatospora herbaricolor]MDQ0305858.1 X-Pro dipeptidyl-peptidase [Kitasatospora herbaricolor]GGV50978.1 hypothetical protein GCM10010495_80750 [Kitasatospora herbaricolor]